VAREFAVGILARIETALFEDKHINVLLIPSRQQHRQCRPTARNSANGWDRPTSGALIDGARSC